MKTFRFFLWHYVWLCVSLLLLLLFLPVDFSLVILQISVFVFKKSAREFMNVLCSRVGLNNHLQAIRNSLIIVIWRIILHHRPTKLCIMFPSLSLFHPWQIPLENSSLITVIYIKCQPSVHLEKCQDLFVESGVDFLKGNVAEKWRTGNHLHRKIICQLQRQRSTMQEKSRRPFHVSLVS